MSKNQVYELIGLNEFPNEPQIHEYGKIFSKKSLGILFNKLESDLNLDEKYINIFKNCNDKRNYLAHHFFNDIDIGTSDDSDMRKKIKDLVSLKKEFKQLELLTIDSLQSGLIFVFERHYREPNISTNGYVDLSIVKSKVKEIKEKIKYYLCT